MTSILNHKQNGIAALASPSGKASPTPGKASPTTGKVSPTTFKASPVTITPPATPAVPTPAKSELAVNTAGEFLTAGKITRNASTSSAESTTKTAVEESHSSSFFTSTKKTIVSRRTMTMRFTESVRRWELKGSVLHAECLLADGHTWKHTTFDLNTCIGNIDGELRWNKQDFYKSICQEHKAHLEGTVLVAKCKKAHSNEYVLSRLDLATHLRNDNGIIVVIAHNEKLSTMLTEVPWMKFKVVAEPDFSVFTTHPVMQEAMARIAQTTAEHVSKQMAGILALAIAEATAVVTASAMEHVSQSMEVMLSTLSGETTATVEHSTSHLSHLHKGSEHFHQNSLPAGKQLTL